MLRCVCTGVLLNVLFPDWLQTLLLTILLLFVINKTVRKGIHQWHQEQAAFKERRATKELHVRGSPHTAAPRPGHLSGVRE